MNPQQIARVLGPDNLALIQAVKEKRRGVQPDFEVDLRKYKKLGIPPHILIGVMVPVYCDVRKAACCFLDEISMPDKETLFQIAKNLWIDYGLFTGLAFVPLGNAVLPYVFFFKDQYIYAEISAITIMGDRGVIHGFNPRLITKMGNILGYPECCIKEFLKQRTLEKNAETDMREALSKTKSLNSAAFFAGEFFPCKVKCENAINIGELILGTLRKEDAKLESAFRIVLDGNIEFAKDARTKYGDVLKNHDGNIEKLFETPNKSFFNKLKTKLF